MAHAYDPGENTDTTDGTLSATQRPAVQPDILGYTPTIPQQTFTALFILQQEYITASTQQSKNEYGSSPDLSINASLSVSAATPASSELVLGVVGLRYSPSIRAFLAGGGSPFPFNSGSGRSGLFPKNEVM